MAKEDKKTRTRTQTVEKEPIPPDGGYGWVVLIGSFFISFLIDGIMYSFGIILPDIAKNFNVSQKEANLLTSLYTGFLFCSGPIVAGLSNALGVRAVVVGGAFVTTVCFVASAFAPNILVMYFFYGIIGGIATGCCYIGSLIIVVQYFDKKKGQATGIVMSGSGFGSFTLAPFATWLLKHYDWKISLIVFGAMVLQCCIFGAFFKPVPYRLVSANKELVNENGTANGTANGSNKTLDNKDSNSKFHQSNTSIALFQSKNNLTNQKPVFSKSNNQLNVTGFAASMMSLGNFNQTLNMKTLEDEFHDQPWYQKTWEIFVKIMKDIADVKLLFQDLTYFLMAMCNFFCFCGLFIPYIYVPKHGEVTGLPKEQTAYILSIIGIVNIPMRLAFGLAADKLQKFVSPITLNTFAIAIAATSIWCIGFLTTFWGQVAFGVVFAFGTAGMNTLPNPYLMEIVGPAKFNNALGIVNLLRGFACFLGPFVGGLIAEKLDNYLYAFYFSALVFTLGGITSLIAGIITTLRKVCDKKTKKNIATEAEMENLAK